jgi:hypothetical protein
MPRRLLFPVFAVLAAAGCLQEGRPVAGRQLFQSRQVERPGFLSIDKVPYVLFQERTSPAMSPRSATYDQWLVNYDTGEPRKLAANVADRDTWRTQTDKAGVRFVMVDERQVDGGSQVGVPSPVGTLARVDLKRGELERIPDVSSFSVSQSGQFFYRTITAGSRLPELHLRTMKGDDRALGPSAGVAQLVAPDRMYFVSGEERVLSRIAAGDAPIEVIRPKVTRFLLSDDEKWAVLQVAEKSSQTVVRELATGTERPLPGKTPCCWMSFDGDEFGYSESATGTAPGKLHTYNVVTGDDHQVILPAGLADVSSVLGRPASGQSLFLDSQGKMALVSNTDPASGRVLDIRPVSPSFSEDGKFLIYVDPDPSEVGEGRLMLQDAEFQAPPRALSPPGSLVPAGGYFFISDEGRRILVFWAHFGRNASDLYFGNVETGDATVVANGISEVTVTARRVFGIMRVSEQDLVGELVNKDLIMNKEIVLAHAVSDSAVWGTRVAFVIRDRIATSRDGLWAIPSDGVTGMMTGK